MSNITQPNLEEDEDDITITSIPIKINLDINIDGNSQSIVLTSSMIYIPPEEPFKPLFTFVAQTNKKPKEVVPVIPDVPLETYPRIPIRDIKLPMVLLRNLKYKEIVQFFFNKEVFSKKMTQWNLDNPKKAISFLNDMSLFNIEDDADAGNENPQRLLTKKEIKNIDVEKQNIELMLHLLFPTYSFYSEGYKTSMQYWNTSEPYLTNTYPKTIFSYLKHNNKTYTITNAVWLNDVFNMPFYQYVFTNYEKYKNWKIETIYRLRNVIEGLRNKIKNQSNPSISRDGPNDIEKLMEVIQLLKKPILSKKEYEDLFMGNNKYGTIYNKYIKDTLSQGSESDNQIYFYNIIFSSSNKVISYSNSRINEMIYFFENIETETEMGTENAINRNQKLLGTMMENMLNYTKSKGDLRRLKRGICPTKSKSKCRPRNEISTFYYPGILYNSTAKNNEPSYEIYLLIDVIEGEVNSKNISGIRCKYENQSIGKKLEYLTKQWPIWDLSNRRIFLKIKGDVLVNKSISKDKGKISTSRISNGNNYGNNYGNQNSSTPFYIVQQTIKTLIKYDAGQSEHKLDNMLKTLRDNISIFQQSHLNQSYMNKVNKTIPNLDSNNTESFVKWLNDSNKYPSPLTGSTNDEYKKMDKEIFDFLNNIETIPQKNTNNTEKVSQLNALKVKINFKISFITTYIKNNEDEYKKNSTNPDYERLNYINFILTFYVSFLNLINEYLDTIIQKIQNQRGGNGLENSVKNGTEKQGVVEKIPKYHGGKNTAKNRSSSSIRSKTHKKRTSVVVESS